MRVQTDRTIVASLVVMLGGAAILSSCASDPAPAAYRRTITQVQKSPKGAWVQVNAGDKSVSGELMAVGKGTIAIGSEDGVVEIPVRRIRALKLSVYTSPYGVTALSTVLGMLSTPSHGIVLVFSAPIWFVSGTLITAIQSRVGYQTHSAPTGEVLRALRRYARFPQGLPPAPRPVPQAKIGIEGGPCFRNNTCDAKLRCELKSRVCVPEPTQGLEDGSCYPNGTCDTGLTCEPGSKICRPMGKVGTEGQGCRPDGSCDEALTCRENRCLPAPSSAPQGPPPGSSQDQSQNQSQDGSPDPPH